jgi:DNA invertase Pin-like site-specific DNA recombinase
VLVVTRLDRLARSTRDLLNILDAIGKAGAGFKSLKDIDAREAERARPDQGGIFRAIIIVPGPAASLPVR